jgi:hypothetical protein
MLLALASAVFLGSESLETRDHILLFQIWDFPFRRLLRKGKFQQQSHIRTVDRGNVFIEPLPRNGFRNTAVLLLRDLATTVYEVSCCPATTINIRPIVERTYARRCLSCRCLAIHVTVYCFFYRNDKTKRSALSSAYSTHIVSEEWCQNFSDISCSEENISEIWSHMEMCLYDRDRF